MNEFSNVNSYEVDVPSLTDQIFNFFCAPSTVHCWVNPLTQWNDVPLEPIDWTTNMNKAAQRRKSNIFNPTKDGTYRYIINDVLYQSS